MFRPEWINFYDSLPRGCAKSQVWDAVISRNKENCDGSACVTVARKKDKIYVMEASVFNIDYPELKKQVYIEAQKGNPQEIFIEDFSTGSMLIRDLRLESTLPLIPTKVKRPKMERFARMAFLMESGRMLFSKGKTESLINEILNVPYGARDDGANALSQYAETIERLYQPPIFRKAIL